MSNSKDNYSFESGNLLLFFYRWRKVLIIITFLAAVAAAVVSLFIPNKYESTVVVFPTSTNSISKTLLAQNSGSQKDLLEFGDEDRAAQLIQVLKSEKIRDYIIKKYDLMKHYKIPKGDKYKYTKLYKQYSDNISFERTKYFSVKINVLDESADTAALIANDISAELDTVKNEIRRQMAVKAFNIVKKAYESQLQYIQSLKDSLNALRKLGVVNYESQTEVLSEELGRAYVQNNPKAVTAIQAKIDTIAKYGGAYVPLSDRLENAAKQLSIVKSKYEQAKVDATAFLQAKFVVNSAHPAEKKSYPIRWLIVVVTALATFLFTLFVIIAFESYKKVRTADKQLKTKEQPEKDDEKELK